MFYVLLPKKKGGGGGGRGDLCLFSIIHLTGFLLNSSLFQAIANTIFQEIHRIKHDNQYKCAHLVFNEQHFNRKACRGGAEVAGWTLDRKIRVRFPAYPHRVWAI